MSAPSSGKKPTSLLATSFIAGVTAWWAYHLGSPLVDGALLPLPALVWAVAAMFGLHSIIVALDVLADELDEYASRKPTGKRGTAAWAKTRDLRGELTPGRTGPFWGLSLGLRKVPLFFGYVSNAMTIAPAGSGKGIFTVVNNILSIFSSKVVTDFKGELACMLKAILEARGEIVRVLNPGNLWPGILGQGDSYNPLDIIADDLTTPGGLRDVMDDLCGMCAQILPEPEGKESENSYFREGSRRLISIAILIETMVELFDTTLSSVAVLIEDRKLLLDRARWIAGEDHEGKPLPCGPFPLELTDWAKLHDPVDVSEFVRLVRSRVNNLISLMTSNDNRTFDSFVTAAQQALAPFAFGRLASAMGRSTFRMSDLKEGKVATTLFIVADASRMEAYKPFVGLVQYCCIATLKRHDNKARPVHFILDEATNYVINGLENLLTFGRSYGIRLHIIFQDLAAFVRAYSQSALDTLLSECEIIQILPGQRSPKTLELISSKMLGDQSVTVLGSGLAQSSDGMNENISESGRPLKTMEELRRMTTGILIVRNLRPIEFEPISYAEIDPWREQVGINPFHGTAFIKKTKLKLKERSYG